MRKNLFKYIFLTIFTLGITFLSLPKFNAAETVIEIGNNQSATVFNSILPGGTNNFKIHFNKTDSNAYSQCNRICAIDCEEWSFAKAETYYCSIANFDKGVYTEISSSNNRPYLLKYDYATVGTDAAKIITKDCFMTWYGNQDETKDSPTWGCSTQNECEKACKTQCTPKKIRSTNSGGEKEKGDAFFCLNNNLRYKNTIFVDVNGELFSWDGVKKSKEEAIKTVGSSGSFLDDWDDIPAVLNGMSDIIDGELTCDSDALQGLIEFLQKIFILMKIGAVLLLVLLTTMDFLKAVSASDDKDLKKATQRFVKRAVLFVFIFLLPSIIELLFRIIEVSNGNCNII